MNTETAAEGFNKMRSDVEKGSVCGKPTYWLPILQYFEFELLLAIDSCQSLQYKAAADLNANAEMLLCDIDGRIFNVSGSYMLLLLLL
jgi:hypothetical protein